MMDRRQLIKIAYDRSAQLKISDPCYLAELATYTLGFLRNDLGIAGDITTKYVNADSINIQRTAIIKAKDTGLLAGLEESMWLYKTMGINAKASKKDGDSLKPGDKIIELSGDIGKLLSVERCGLNLLQRMSGIASTVHKINCELGKLQTNSIIAGSRKTVLFTDNKAVSIAGGYTHRLGLWESIMIKDNHLAELKLQGFDDSIGEAIKRAWQCKDKSVSIVIEVLALDEACRAAQMFKQLNNVPSQTKPCIIMLDHFKPDAIEQVIAELKKQGLYDYDLI